MEDWAGRPDRAPSVIEVREIVGRILSIIEKSPNWWADGVRWDVRADETWKGWGRR